MKNLTFTFLFVMSFAFTRANAQDTIKLSDFGHKPNSRINAVSYVKKALEVCRTKQNPVLVFPIC